MQPELIDEGKRYRISNIDGNNYLFVSADSVMSEEVDILKLGVFSFN